MIKPDYQTVLEAYAHYLDPNGLVSSSSSGVLNAAPISGNNIRFTCEYMKLLPPGSAEYYRVGKALIDCQVELGLLARDKNNSLGQQSFDDTICALSVSKGAAFPKNFVIYGKKHWWCFNNLNPGKWSWDAFLGRNPALIAQAYEAAGKGNLLTKAIIALAGIFAAFSTSQDGKMLSYMMLDTLPPNSLRWIKMLWNYKLKKQYGDGMLGAVLHAYHIDKKHPSIKFYQGVGL